MHTSWFTPFETLPHGSLAPKMKGVEPCNRGPIRHETVSGDFGKAAHDKGRRRLSGGRCGDVGSFQFLLLRMKVSRQKPEALCFNLKTAATFRDAAFAYD